MKEPSTKEVIENLKSKGIVASYESHIEVDPGGIIVGLILLVMPIILFLSLLPKVDISFLSLVCLLPLITGLFFTTVGIQTLLRKR